MPKVVSRKAAPPKAKPARKAAPKRAAPRASEPAATVSRASSAISGYDATRHAVTLYALDVVEGRVVAGRQVIAACRRHLRDLDRAREADATIRFNAALADRAIGFCQLLALTKGKGAGATLHLEPWQAFVVGSLFGWQRLRESGKWLRRYRTAYVEIARKNGKTTLAAAIALYLMLADGEPGPEVYAGATKFDQAAIVWDEARAMVRANPSLRKLVRALRRPPMVCEARRAKFDVLTAAADTADGLNVHGAIVDEYHEHKTASLYNVLETGTGARDQSLILVITTAGTGRETPCWAEREYTETVVSGTISDDTRFGYVAELDEEDDPFDEACWVKANPNLGVNVSLEDLRDKARRAKQMPTARNDFLRKHLNVWTQSEVRWIPPELWDACEEKIPEQDLVGLPCTVGLDLGDTSDFTACVLAFDLPDGRVALRPYFFIPADPLAQRSERDKRVIAQWVAEGLIEYAGDRYTSGEFLVERIAGLCEKFRPSRIACDPWHAQYVTEALETQYGLPFLKQPQGHAGLVGGTRALEALVAEKRLVHDGNPVLRWMAGNVSLSMSKYGNVMPDKKRSREKIDGIVASIFAIDALIRAGNDAPGSVYSTRDVRVIG